MRKTVLTILGALLIGGSAVQMAAASEHHARTSHRASLAGSQQLRNSNNSMDANGPRYNDTDFDRRNTFN